MAILSQIILVLEEAKKIIGKLWLSLHYSSPKLLTILQAISIYTYKRLCLGKHGCKNEAKSYTTFSLRTLRMSKKVVLWLFHFRLNKPSSIMTSANTPRNHILVHQPSRRPLGSCLKTASNFSSCITEKMAPHTSTWLPHNFLLHYPKTGYI